MGTYVVTGGAMGIGAAVKEKLMAEGHSVLVVDIKDADIVADLSTKEGRDAAIREILSATPDGIDGFVPCAGLGFHVSDWPMIISVNYFGVRYLTEALKDHVAKKGGRVVIVSSNSAAIPGLSKELVQILDDNDEEKAREFVATLDSLQAYGGSKKAIAQWMRQVTPEFLQAGVAINAIAPGTTNTALFEDALANEKYGQAAAAFKCPLGRNAEPPEIADVILFLLSQAASYIAGSVVFADGGMDAQMRPNRF